MQSNKPILFILLCFTILTMTDAFSSKLNRLLEAANKMGIVSERVSDNKSNVYINKEVYEIYIYDPIHVKGEQSLAIISKDDFSPNKTLSKLYVCINCVFAEWVRDELVSLVEQLPVFYQSGFEQEHDYVFVKYSNEFNNKLNHNILNTTEKFIDVLLNFQGIFLNDLHDTSNDTRILTALLLLHFKTDYILRDSAARVKKSDVNVVRLITEEINSIQHFLYLNCKMSLRYDNRHLFGLSTKNDGLKVDSINTFVDYISPLGLNSVSCCTVNKMLWSDIARPFGQTKWHTKNSYIYVDDVMQTIAESYDLLKIYWYQQNMFNTIMIHLFTLTLEHFKKYHITQDVVDKFRFLRSIALSGISNLQSDLIKCFHLMKSNVGLTYSEDNTLVKAINVYKDSHYNIVLKTSTNNDDIASVENDYVSTMNKFLSHLIEYSDYFKCFVRLFEYLHSQYDGVYYRPFENYSKISATLDQVMTKDEFKSEDEEIQEFQMHKLQILEKNEKGKSNYLNDVGCNYFSNLYHICLHASVELNLAYSENNVSEPGEELDYYPRIQHNLTKLKDALIELVTNYWYLPHFKTILNIIPQIESKSTEYFHNEYNEDLRRTVYVVMTELNSCSIKLCSPPEYNFMFFDNLHFDVTGKLSLLYNRAWVSMFTLKNSVDRVTKQKYTKTVDVFDSIFKIDGFETYNDVIQIRWKGENKNVRYIFKNLTSIALSSIDWYSFYDVSLKFIFAAICFEIHQVISGIPIQNKEYDIKYNLADDADEKKFPKKFANIIKMIINFAKFLSRNNRKSLARRVTGEFEKIGVIIQIEKSIPLKFIKDIEGESDKRKLYLANLELAVDKVKKLRDISVQVNESLNTLSKTEITEKL